MSTVVKDVAIRAGSASGVNLASKGRKKYALCGLSIRSIYHFVRPIIGKNWDGGTNFDDKAQLVGILDIDEGRVRNFMEQIGAQSVPYYPGDAMGRMLKEAKPDVVIVTGPDYTHCDHIVAALDAGCDVIAEKPMVINCEQAQRVREAEQRSGHRVHVAFNYRYASVMQKLKQLVLDGKVGRITNVELIYNLDTFHGASYFYRWNRERDKSGGLSIHKSCHHFDLINWLVDDVPEEVFAYGALNYYGRNGAHRPRDEKGRPLDSAAERQNCPYFRQHYVGKCEPDAKMPGTGWDMYSLPYDVQYPADKKRYIYDDAIDIEDTYSAIVRYRGGVSLSYSCNFSTPWEGYILAINGTGGRLEVSNHANPDPTGKTLPAGEKVTIIYYPLFGGKETFEVSQASGGHGGADFIIQRDLLDKPCPKSLELKLLAGSEDGAFAVAIGEGVWRSIKERRPMRIDEMLGLSGASAGPERRR